MKELYLVAFVHSFAKYWVYTSHILCATYLLVFVIEFSLNWLLSHAASPATLEICCLIIWTLLIAESSLIMENDAMVTLIKEFLGMLQWLHPQFPVFLNCQYHPSRKSFQMIQIFMLHCKIVCKTIYLSDNS